MNMNLFKFWSLHMENYIDPISKEFFNTKYYLKKKKHYCITNNCLVYRQEYKNIM